MSEQLRAYFFNNMYLTGIHAGIQAQHCATDMFLEYTYEPGAGAMLYDWANNHKTTIILNAGYAENLRRIVGMLGNEDNPYPWTHFNESQEALEGCITSVGVILPEKVYGLNQRKMDLAERQKTAGCYLNPSQCYMGMSKFDIDLANEVSKYKLMN